MGECRLWRRISGVYNGRIDVFIVLGETWLCCRWTERDCVLSHSVACVWKELTFTYERVARWKIVDYIPYINPYLITCCSDHKTFTGVFQSTLLYILNTFYNAQATPGTHWNEPFWEILQGIFNGGFLTGIFLRLCNLFFNFGNRNKSQGNT